MLDTAELDPSAHEIVAGGHEFYGLSEDFLGTDPERVSDYCRTQKSVLLIGWFILHDFSGRTNIP